MTDYQMRASRHVSCPTREQMQKRWRAFQVAQVARLKLLPDAARLHRVRSFK